MIVDALYRATSFSTLKIQPLKCNQKLCVNALQRATSFLHEEKNIMVFKTRNVSMPFNGLPLFLHYDEMVESNIDMCQCPSTGYLFFYKYTDIWSYYPVVCQCPSTGYLFFYGCSIILDNDKEKMCQCPSTGYLFFYPYPFK